MEKKNIVHRDLAAREASSGMATGKREATAPDQVQDKKTEVSGDPHEYSTRETGSGMATGRRQHQPVTLTETNDSADKHKNNMTGAQSNPMYKDGGMQGTNPLHQGKEEKVQSGVNTPAGAVANGASVVKTKTKSNQSNDRVAPAQPAPPQSKKN